MALGQGDAEQDMGRRVVRKPVGSTHSRLDIAWSVFGHQLANK